jgi:acyl carrier protein
MVHNIGKEVLSFCLDIDINEIKDDANMYNLIEWDSLSHIKIVLEIEERLQRELNTEEIIEISDLESINKLFT